MNDQRKVVFEQRKDLMRALDVQETIVEMRADVIDALVSRFIPANAYAEQWQVDSLHEEVLRLFNLDLPLKDWAKEERSEEHTSELQSLMRISYAVSCLK